MRNSYLKKACWMIATINANMHAYLGQEDLLMDRELHEIIANAFKNGIYDNQLDNTSCQECKNTLEIFKKICLRNKNCMNFISNTIESNDLKYYLKKPPKEVLVVFTKAEIKNSDLISQYSLILHIDISQVKCKVNEDWYDCTGNKPRVSKYSNASFPAILVYLRKDLNPLVNDQISVQNPSYEHSPDYGRELSPSLNSLGGNLSNFDYSNQYEILDTNPKILENKQNYNQIISNSTTIENYFTYLEEKLAKKIEKDLESKSKEIIEKLLVQFQEKIGSIANNIEAKSEGEIIDMQNKLENNFNYWEEMLLNKVKELEKCFKDNEEKQNNSLSTEELLKGDRILDYMKSAVNANNSEIISKLDELEIKSAKANSVIDTCKEYTDMQLQGIKAELNELQKNCKANSEGLSENSSFFEDLNRKIKSIENENQISIEKIKSELKDIEKIKNKSDEKLDSLFGEIEKSKNYNKDIQNWQFYVNEDIKSIKSEIEKYKSGIPSQTLAISNQPQITSNPDFYSQTRTLPQNHHINAQNERSEREAQLLNAHIQTQSLRPQRFSKSGLPNIGNTCYMNSVIQILASSADFAEYLYSIPGDDLLQSLNSVILSINANYGKNKTIPLIENFKQLISREYSMYSGRSANDAKELFIIISNKVENKSLFTIVKNQSFTCNSRFKHKSWSEDSTNFIAIPKNRQNNIEAFLNDIKEQKSFSGKNQLSCEECGKLKDIVMKTERIEWPRILTIYISDRQILGEIPEMLNLENNSYQIFGVICYYGYHFIAFTKNDENEWEKYDDSEVSKKDPDWGRLFLAFYKKN